MCGVLCAATADNKMDALQVALNVYKVVFENDRVRVLGFVTEPGQNGQCIRILTVLPSP